MFSAHQDSLHGGSDRRYRNMQITQHWAWLKHENPSLASYKILCID